MKETPSSSPSALDPAFTELREAYESGNLVIFAGAGVSAAAGLPGWKRLVELLAERARARKADPAALQEIAELTASRQYIDALSALRDCLGATEFGIVIERHLDDKLSDEPEVARAIAALAPRLRAVLTTNIDHLLERAFAGRWPTLPRATGDLAQRREFILKLHGTLLDRSSWVFTREDYDRATFADPNLHGTFTALFHAVPLLFVGYGLSDDDFDQHLGRVRAFAGAQPPRHFALVPADSVTPLRRKRLESSGVRLIPYDNPDGRHTAVVELLRQLAPPPAARGPGASASTRPLSVYEALGHIQAAGFTVSREPPRELERARPPALTLMQRLLRCMEVPGTTVWLGQRDRKGDEPREPLAALLSLPPQGGFALHFHTDVLSSSARGLVTGLAKELGSHGGSVRVYGREPPSTPPAGIEGLGLREALEPLVRDPLGAHAQRCLTAWSEVDEHRFVATRARLRDTGEVLPVAEAFEQALDTHGRVLVLGDFGTGKSTHLKRRAALMAKAFLEEPLRAPAPLLLPLVGMPLELEALAAKHAPGLSGEAFRLAVDLGLAVPLFDGLDEMQLAPHQLEGAIGTLLGAFSEKEARAMLTSRKTLFPDPARVMAMRPAGPSSWEVIELEDLDRSEVIEFVGRRTPSAEAKNSVLEDIRRTHDLTSLSKRPVLLDLIVKSQERLSSREMSAAQLYAVAAEDWLESRKEQEHHVVREYRLAFARSLARKLFDSGAANTTYNEVARLVLEVLGDRHVPISDAVLEVHTAVFLAHDEQEGRFRFAHRSFLEYFLAVDISARLDAGREDALALPRLTPEIVSFLAGMEGWEGRKELLRQVLTTRYEPRISENALLALYFATRERVGEGEALGQALESELPTGIRLEGARLAEVDLPWLSLPGASLAGAELSGARLARADLRGARLDRARADHAILDGAVLDDASFLEADLFRASVVDASIERVRWGGAHREGWIDLHVKPSRSRASEGGVPPPRAVVHTRSGSVSHLAWSPDRRRLASGANDGTVRVWDARSGELLHRLEGHEGSVLTVAYAPDGSRLASGAHDGTVRMWDARSGELLHRLEGHSDWVRTVAYAPDGSRLASGSYDGTVRVWEAHSGTPRTLLVLASTQEDWLALAADTPFFTGEGNLTRLLHYVSGPCAMPAALWSPLFRRPDLVREALEGKPLDLKALGLDSYEACESALLAERKRLGLVQRRSVRGEFRPAAPPPEPAPTLTLPLSTVTLGLRRGGQRPPVSVCLEVTGLSPGMELSAVLHLGSQRLPATKVALERSTGAPDAATLQLQLEVPGPGEGLLAVTSRSQHGHEHTETLTVSFVPENPYIVGPPIDHPKDFYGREDDLSRILRQLEQGHVALIGEMRIGKSSLLNQLEHRLSGSCQVVSLQRHVSNLEALPTRLAGLISPSERLEGDSYDMLDRALTFRLTELARTRGPGARFTLLLDEAQLLTRSDSVRHELRNLFQSRRRDGLRVLVAGPPHAMRELAHDPTGSPFLNIFLPYRLGAMSHAELTRLARTPLGDEYTVTDEAVERLAALSGGRPLIAQLLCHHSLEACHVSRRFRIDEAEIEQVFRDKAFDDVIDIYGYPGRWAHLPEQVREVLRRLAGLPAAEREPLDTPTLRLLDAHGLADKVKKRLDVEPTFFLWIQEVLS